MNNTAEAYARVTGSRGATVVDGDKVEHFGDTGKIGNDFDRFAPSAEQVAFAAKYATENDLDRVFVGINCPGKRYGLWMFGQAVNPIMDPDPQMDQFMIWENRNDVLDELKPGDAAFVVYADGLVGSAIEYL